ncbi:MAG: phospholipid carrier-dependent glycosyltransferase [Pseudomonadota bacterium]|nr:phospholipid carrier-dependent glycosyltransferase [Pseudomonadota bacterium]
MCKSFKDDNVLWVIGALFAFWPAAIIHSVRIGNDPMLYFLFTASLYHITRWYRHDQKRDLMIASLVGAAAILTKANGEILVAVLGVIGLYKMISTKQWATYFKMAIAPCFIMLLAVAITVGPGLILKMQGKRDKLYIDNIDGLSQANLVGNTAANYFWFDAKTFITEPFTDPYDDRMGRQFFWNYLGKTGLFGEFKYPALLNVNTAVICSFLAVLMFIYMLFGIYRMAKEDFKRMAPVLLSGFFLWAGVTYMRMTFPANIDFRYIVPIILTFCALYGVSILRFQQQGATRLANVGLTMSALFSLSALIFIWGIYLNS